MKKVAVITRHAIANYGSLLQAFATEELIRQLGHDPLIIDYCPKQEHLPQRETLLLASKPNWSSNPVKRLIYLALRLPPAYWADARFARERRALLAMSRPYGSAALLESSPPQADIYLTGSDQVWGPIAGGSMDKAYCLSFAPQDGICISFAASFGKSDFVQANQDAFSSLLSRYRMISVREDSGITQLAQMGIPAVQVLDPTLMLSENDWKPFGATRPLKQDYVLVYQLHNNPELNAYAKRAARELGLPLVRLSASLHQISRGGRFVYLPDSHTFLSYIRHARCVITDSFHATAFSINFSTPFVNILSPEQNTDRIMSLLRLTGLKQRLLSSPADTALAAAPVDFTNAHAALSHAREKSLIQLRNAIEC